MVTEHWRKARVGMFPWVKDWSASHDELRYSTNVKAMNYKTWLFFHVSAYSLIVYGINLLSLINFGLIAFYTYQKEWYMISFISLAIFIIFLYSLVMKMRKWKTIKTMNLYDIFLRDDEAN